ncbi:unnamed protein product, partial [marine sediment metagenome]
MILARTLGNVVSTIKHPAHRGRKNMVVQPVAADTITPAGRSFLAFDSVQAGPGDLVLVAQEGNASRQVMEAPRGPFHAVIVGIVDRVD